MIYKPFFFNNKRCASLLFHPLFLSHLLIDTFLHHHHHIILFIYLFLHRYLFILFYLFSSPYSLPTFFLYLSLLPSRLNEAHILKPAPPSLDCDTLLRCQCQLALEPSGVQSQTAFVHVRGSNWNCSSDLSAFVPLVAKLRPPRLIVLRSLCARTFSHDCQPSQATYFLPLPSPYLYFFPFFPLHYLLLFVNLCTTPMILCDSRVKLFSPSFAS